MSALALTVLVIVVAALAAVAFGPQVLASLRRFRRRRRRAPVRHHGDVPDPGQMLRAERKAEQLLAGVVGEQAFEAYRALGFLYSFGPEDADGRPAYGYLIYPHRPIVSFDARSGELLSELCVTFPDRSESDAGERLPDADDVLAKWMALKGDEQGLIGEANMHLPGRQLDPAHVRRDVVRLSEWTGRIAARDPLERF